MKYYIQFAFAFICAGAVALMVIPMAAADRGFSGGVGGELFVILFAAVIGHKIGAAAYNLLWR